MEHQTSRPRGGIIFLLILMAGVILLQRIKLNALPVSNDICAYAVIGHEMMRGRALYSDLWERKPPLLYATFSAAEGVAGYNRSELFLLGMVTATAILVLIFAAGQSGGRGAVAGIIAAALWVLLNTDLDLAGNEPHPETFINVCMTGAFLLLMRWPNRRRFSAAVWLGTLLAAATLYKHNMALACVALLMGHALIPGARKMSDRLIDSFIGGMVVIAVWSAMACYFAANHRLGAFVDVLIHQNLSYTGNMGSNFVRSFEIWRLFPPFMVWGLGPIGLCAVLALFGARDAKVCFPPRRDWLLLLSWGIGTFLTIGLIGYRYPHYYQLWLPLSCIAGGWAGAGLISGAGRVPPVLGYCAVAICFGFLLFRQSSEFLLTPRQWIDRQYGYCDLTEQNQLGMQLGGLLKPGEQFFELGEDNCLYFLSRCSPPTGLLFIDPYAFGDETRMYWNRLLGDLDRTRPALVVLSDGFTPLIAPDAPIYPWLKKSYFVWDTPLGWPHYKMLVRRGSALEGRINQATALESAPRATDAQPPPAHH